MSSLNQQKCEACQVGALKLNNEEINGLKTQIPNWEITSENDVMMLTREFKFKNFKLALVFANKVAELAEKEFHHPAILLEWGKVKVTWWTHAIKGLHNNDFICAAKTDELLND